jgi:hypothetical protein
MSHKGRSLKDLKRRNGPFREPYDRVLIVTEGKKTEPYYFESMKDDLKLSSANVRVDPNSDSSPRSIVLYAKQLYKKDLGENGRNGCFNRVYCVFDKDEHETYHEALDSIHTATPNGVYFPITSIPCFEYWLLLHFSPISSKPYYRSGTRSPGENAKHDLKSHLPNYTEGDKTIYQQLRGKIDTAMKNAKKINDAAKDSDFDNPSTSIPDLIDYLRNLKKQ